MQDIIGKGPLGKEFW